MARGQLNINSQVVEITNGDLAEAFAAFGLQYEDEIVVDQDEFWLWPENEEVFWLWAGLQTQWIVGMSGAFGLNYASVESDMRLLGVLRKNRRDYYILIKHMEQAALEEWASKR